MLRIVIAAAGYDFEHFDRQRSCRVNGSKTAEAPVLGRPGDC